MTPKSISLVGFRLFLFFPLLKKMHLECVKAFQNFLGYCEMEHKEIMPHA